MRIPNREIDAALHKAFSIPGLYGRDEARFLYKLARRKGNLVEIGAWMGRTTALLQQAAQIWRATLTTIDPFIPIKGRAVASPERWAANLRKQEIVPPPLHVAPSAEIAVGWTEPLALVFIDGAHDYASVLQDLRLWTPFIGVGGDVALHDMFGPLIPGVAAAVNTWWQAEHDDWKARWSCLGLVNLTIAFRRVG